MVAQALNSNNFSCLAAGAGPQSPPGACFKCGQQGHWASRWALGLSIRFVSWTLQLLADGMVGHLRIVSFGCLKCGQRRHSASM